VIRFSIVDDDTSAQLSHALPKTVYADDMCISCKVVDENDKDGNQNDQNMDQILDMCQQLYESSAKCESSHGFSNGYASYNGYENQAGQESMVCEFIEAIKAGTYDESGEIVVNGSKSSAGGDPRLLGVRNSPLLFLF